MKLKYFHNRFSEQATNPVIIFINKIIGNITKVIRIITVVFRNYSTIFIEKIINNKINDADGDDDDDYYYCY